MQETQDTDLTIELFNFCRGTCTGCMLSASERKEESPNLSIDDFKTAVTRLNDYSKISGLRFRSVLTFGDVIWMPLPTLKQYFEAAAKAGIRLGSTMTLVDDKWGHYEQAIKMLKSIDETAVFDITVDPVRLDRYPDYAKRLRAAIEQAPHCHTQVLLSEAVIELYEPEELSKKIASHLGRSAVLGFAASLSNISHKNYRYNVKSAADYARRYYQATPQSLHLMTSDLMRYKGETKDSDGNYSDFLKQTLHIGHDLNIYPTAYTVFGDVILDQRNHSRAIGSLRTHSLSELLGSIRMLSMNAINKSTLDSDKIFGCSSCEFNASCSYNGVGMVRKIYSDFETKSASCYGPKSLLGHHTALIEDAPLKGKTIPIKRA